MVGETGCDELTSKWDVESIDGSLSASLTGRMPKVSCLPSRVGTDVTNGCAMIGRDPPDGKIGVLLSWLWLW